MHDPAKEVHSRAAHRLFRKEIMRHERDPCCCCYRGLLLHVVIIIPTTTTTTPTAEDVQRRRTSNRSGQILHHEPDIAPPPREVDAHEAVAPPHIDEGAARGIDVR